jgi:hypothetical protein
LTDTLERAQKSGPGLPMAAENARALSSRHLGLNFLAPFSLAGAPAAGPDVDVTVAVEGARPVPSDSPGPVLAEWAIGGTKMYTLYETGTGKVFRVHGLCEFNLSHDASTVRCYPGPNCDEGLLHVLMAGTVAALLHVLRGRAVLHASAVRHGKETFLFTGPSGTGKTTVAALCCAAGALLVSDDVVVLAPGPSGVACLGLGQELRLREQAHEIAGLFGPPPLQQRVTADGRLAVQPPRAQQERNPVALVALPRPVRGPKHVEARQLGPSRAVAALVGNARILGLVAPALQRAHFEAVAQLVAKVPVIEVAVPWGPPFELATAQQLLSVLKEEARRP